MSLEGWNHIPHGYTAEFDLAGAPWWLRLWFRAPFLDRFAYPLVVSRGHGYLTVKDFIQPQDREPVGAGWRVREPHYRDSGTSYGGGR